MRHFAASGVLLLLVACGGPSEDAQRGADCFRDDECAYGLICAAPAGGGDRVCTDDVTALVSVVEPPVAAGGADAAPAAGGAAPATSGAPPVAGTATRGGNTAGQ